MDIALSKFAVASIVTAGLVLVEDGCQLTQDLEHSILAETAILEGLAFTDGECVLRLVAYDFELVEPGTAVMRSNPISPQNNQMSEMSQAPGAPGAPGTSTKSGKPAMTGSGVSHTLMNGPVGVGQDAQVSQDPFAGDPEARKAAGILAARARAQRGSAVLDSDDRIAGKHRIDLNPETEAMLNASTIEPHIESLRVEARICVSALGVPRSATMVETSGVPSLDDRIRAELLQWRYRPQRIDGQPVPFCEHVRFRYEVDILPPK